MKNHTIFFSAKQVSEYLQTPLRTVHHLSQCGKIKAIKIGGKWRYSKEDIEKYHSFGTNFSKQPARRSYDLVERRYYPRINTNFKCQYSINIPPFRNINSEGIIKNLSTGGVLLFGQNGEIDRVEVDDPVTVDSNLLYEEKTVNIRAVGRIVRMDNDTLGIKFRNIPEQAKNEIIQYIG